MRRQRSMAEVEPVYTVREVGARLGLSATSIRRLVARGELRAVEIEGAGHKHRTLRFTEGMVKRFLRAHTTKAAPAKREADSMDWYRAILGRQQRLREARERRKAAGGN